MLRRRISSNTGMGCRGNVYDKIFTLIINGEWDKVRKMLRKDAAKCCRHEDNTGLIPLAVAVSSFAPLDIIKTMIDAYPGSTYKVDQFGATPLHLACLNGTSPEVVRLFLQHDHGRSVKIVDRNNYTVLHHAVEYVCVLIEKRHTSPDFLEDNTTITTEYQEYLEIIQLLCDAYPEMVHISTTDKNDTPLDIPQVILLRVNLACPEHQTMIAEIRKIYHILKRTSIHVYLTNKVICEESSNRDRREIETEKSGKSVPSVLSSHESKASRDSTMIDTDTMALSAFTESNYD